MTSSTSSKRPHQIDLDLKSTELRLVWGDGHLSVYSLTYLRRICPCAGCETQRQNTDPLRVLADEQANAQGRLRPQNPAEVVGNYALQFFWLDGHQTGIYSFDFLRRMCPCSECVDASYRSAQQDLPAKPTNTAEAGDEGAGS